MTKAVFAFVADSGLSAALAGYAGETTAKVRPLIKVPLSTLPQVEAKSRLVLMCQRYGSHIEVGSGKNEKGLN
jgi:hypothetical protein